MNCGMTWIWCLTRLNMGVFSGKTVLCMGEVLPQRSSTEILCIMLNASDLPKP